MKKYQERIDKIKGSLPVLENRLGKTIKKNRDVGNLKKVPEKTFK